MAATKMSPIVETTALAKVFRANKASAMAYVRCNVVLLK